jgi:hypothetical protein
VVGLDPGCLLSRLGSRGYPVRLRRSETKIAVDKGAAFSRACASVTGLVRPSRAVATGTPQVVAQVEALVVDPARAGLASGTSARRCR